MALKFKEGVTLRGLKAETLLAMQVATDVVKEQEGKDCIITSITDGVHSKGSVHKDGYAFDMRAHHLSNPSKVAAALKARLTSGYDVLLESIGKPNMHIHVELSPERN